jgi:polyisoprenoid-binding protein YceI
MKYRAITFGFAACLFSALAFAEDTWTLDSSTSNARLYHGSKASPDSVNTGVARVTGKVTLDTNDPNKSVFDLSIYPAAEYWSHVLSANGASPAGYVPDATDHTLLTFKSTRILKTGNGKFAVVGDLTLTYVERAVTAVPTEAYAGAVYGDPVIHNKSHEITFLFPSLNAVLLPTPLTSAPLQNIQAQEVVGSARIGHEDFPELLNAIKETNWPSVVQNKDCHTPSVGEDYSGAQCAGTLIAATNDDNCHMPASVSEDYSGILCTPATGSQTTIVLDLKFLHTAPGLSVGMLSGSGATR